MICETNDAPAISGSPQFLGNRDFRPCAFSVWGRPRCTRVASAPSSLFGSTLRHTPGSARRRYRRPCCHRPTPDRHKQIPHRPSQETNHTRDQQTASTHPTRTLATVDREIAGLELQLTGRSSTGQTNQKRYFHQLAASPRRLRVVVFDRQGRGVVSKRTRAGRETPLLPATGCDQPQCATKNADDLKSKESHALDALMPHDATRCEERRRRDSNPGWQICNPRGACMALRQTCDRR